jgi:broad specificity phosphatase PhoE
VPGRLADLAPEELQAAFLGAFRGVPAGPSRFLGGETIDELFDRVLPALDRLLGDPSWDPAYRAGRSTAMEELWAQYRGPQPA